MLRRFFAAACVLTLLVLAEKPLSAGGIDPTETVTENGMTLGTISMDINNQGMANANVSGNFMVTKIDPKTGKPYTLDALAKSLGEDHFNWLQDLTLNTDITITSLKDPNDPTGDTVKRMYKKGDTIIDPQSGGQSFDGKTGQWADGSPWYYDEGDIPKDFDGGKKKVKSKDGIEWSADPGLTLGSKASGSTLQYGDQPGGTNITISFMTFLVSVGPGNKYKPLAGFTWQETFDGSGNGTINLDTDPKDASKLKPATFSKGINDEINSQGFGNWTLVTPEPSSIMLLATGLFGAVPFRLWRRRQAA
jgi:hypothetical protein